MDSLFVALTRYSSDHFAFYLMQAAIIFLLIISITIEYYRSQKKGPTLSVERGEKSMMLLYGSYAAVNGIIIAICLSTDAAKNHRVFFVIFNSLILAYLFLYNSWFRNKLFGWAYRLTKTEVK